MRWTIVLFVLGTTHVSHAQLSGTYSIVPGGGFENLQAAVQAAVQEGLADTTIFILYPEASTTLVTTFDAIPGASATTPLIIRSSESDSSAVSIGRLVLQHTGHIRFEGLTITAPAGSNVGAVYLDRCRDIAFSRCAMMEVVPVDYAYNEALLKVRLPAELPRGDVLFDRCHAVSSDELIWTMFEHGDLKFRNCTLEGAFQVMGGTKYFADCSITSTSIESVSIMEYLRCTFNSPTNVIRLQGHLLKDSDFECDVDLRVGESRGNRFKNVEASFSSGLFAGNIADTTRFIFSHTKPVIGNRFNGPVYGDGDQMRYYNNSFAKGLYHGNGPGQQIRYNSFAPGSTLRTQNSGGLVEFNSLWHVNILGPSIMLLRTNNYAATEGPDVYYSSYDPSPTFHDPMYDTTGGYWKMTNHSMAGRSSTPWPHSTLDIDSLQRTMPAATAPNILCLEGSGLPDSLAMICGQQMALRLCPGMDHLVLAPIPSNGIINMSTVAPGEGMYVYLSDTSGTLLDSCWVHRVPFPDLGPTQLYAYCGFPRKVKAMYPVFADSMLWSPAYLFNDPTEPMQTIQSDTTVFLTSTVYSEACGNFQQTFQLNVSGNPIAFLSATTNLDTLFYEAYDGCCDSLRWDLGDGNYSTEPSGTHNYTVNTWYLVTLTCWLEGDSGANWMIVVVSGVGMQEYNEGGFSLYPNPAGSMIVLSDGTDDGTPAELSIMDMLGRMVLTKSLSLPAQIDVSSLMPAQYIVEIKRPGQIIRSKMIVRRE